jgi:hypothetical protein
MCRLPDSINDASLKRRGTEEVRMVLHQRGVDLLVNLMDAEEHFDVLDREELRRLISEAVIVFGEILRRDVPTVPIPPPESGQIPSSGQSQS